MIRSALIFLLILATVLPTTSRAIENPSVRSPVGSGIVPPSSSGAGLIKTPNPIDTSYNRVITGGLFLMAQPLILGLLPARGCLILF